MLDINFIRENKDLIKEAARKKRSDFEVGKLIEVDDKRRELQSEVDDLRAKQNRASDEIAQMADEEAKQQKIQESKEAKQQLQEKEEELQEVMRQWQELMLAVPNIPDMSVPDGDDDSANQEVKRVGDQPEFSFESKDHATLLTENGMADFERGTKVHGFRGYFLTKDGALLSHALWDYARDFFSKKGFEYMIPPTVVNKEYFYGTGHLPSDAEDLYQTQDEQFLAGTSEVPVMAYHAEETLSKDDLPRRFLAFSPCYRREAGSYGKDTKGLMRVHEFYKLEQVVLCEADHERSVELHEELQRNHEELIESLGLAYRQVVLASGDLKESQVKCYDTELWVPSEGEYREIASASYYHDFQTRRFNIRYTDQENRKKYVHSLNATAVPTPRILIALVEQYQQADSSVAVPEVLRPYLNDREIFSG
jgi:seryl-tRNA synthetase